MECEWNEFPLEDCMEAIIDYRGKTPKKTASGIPLITAKIIKGGSIQPVTEFIAEEDYESWMRRGIPEPGDIVMTTEAPLGEVAQLDDRKVALAQRVITLRGKSGLLDNTFLKYLISSHRIQHQLEGRATGTTVKGIKQSELRQIVLDFPSLQEQKAIAHILGTLDDKIELNRQMNATLEAIAQTLFKSWFVNFDPVIDNALAAGNPIPEPLQKRAEARKALGDQRKPLPDAIQKLFPNSFVFNDDLGWVPDGWEAGVFRNIAEHVKDNVKSDGVGDFDFYVGLEHIGKKELFLSNNASGESIGSNKSRFTKKDLLFGKLRPYFHKVCLAPQDGICSTDILVFRAKDAFSHSYMTLTAYRDEFVEYANLRSTGTRMPRASAQDMLDCSIIIPVPEITEFFEAQVAAIWDQGMQNVGEARDLAKLRDTLLPKLLSGQLRIPEAEKRVAEVL